MSKQCVEIYHGNSATTASKENYISFLSDIARLGGPSRNVWVLFLKSS